MLKERDREKLEALLVVQPRLAVDDALDLPDATRAVGDEAGEEQQDVLDIGYVFGARGLCDAASHEDPERALQQEGAECWAPVGMQP